MKSFEFPIIESSDEPAATALLERRPRRDALVERRASRIVERVRREGDRALLRFARQFDGLAQPIEVTPAEMREAESYVAPAVRKAIGAAARNITRVARRQLPKPWTLAVAPGVQITQRVLPLDRVGCYVPGGRYPLPSSLLMTAIPAIVAGVPEVIVACPKPDAVVLFAACKAGVTRVFRMGGAQAIAALAYGTRTVPRVDKVVGPGNAYVTAAKALIAPECAIDFHAGPSEIAIVSSSGRPAWIAADLIAQAEHDPDARAILITPSRRLAAAVSREVATQLPGAGPARQALSANGGIVLTPSLDEAIALCQHMAPEHVVCDTAAVAARLTQAGTVFAGAFSAQASGDYATGSNHVLPTSGAARARGGLSASDFVRVSTVQHMTRGGIRRIGPIAVTLARAEGLEGHARSIELRIDGNDTGEGRKRERPF